MGLPLDNLKNRGGLVALRVEEGSRVHYKAG